VYGGLELGLPAAADAAPVSVRHPRYGQTMAKRPSRIELLELDIDLRLADLWGEAVAVDEWSLDVVAALMRAAYGKGYCDALTEADPGSLCRDHGYVVPGRGPSSPVEG
jgi:hypothetical protein